MKRCGRLPRGWRCKFERGHDGPCGGWPRWWNVVDRARMFRPSRPQGGRVAPEPHPNCRSTPEESTPERRIVLHQFAQDAPITQSFGEPPRTWEAYSPAGYLTDGTPVPTRGPGPHLVEDTHPAHFWEDYDHPDSNHRVTAALDALSESQENSSIRTSTYWKDVVTTILRAADAVDPLRGGRK